MGWWIHCKCCLFTAKVKQKQTNKQKNNSKLCELSKPKNQKLIVVVVCSLVFLPLLGFFLSPQMKIISIVSSRKKARDAIFLCDEQFLCRATALATFQNNIPFLTSFCLSFFLFFSNKI